MKVIIQFYSTEEAVSLNYLPLDSCAQQSGVLLISLHKKPTYITMTIGINKKLLKFNLQTLMLNTSESPFTHAPFLFPMHYVKFFTFLFNKFVYVQMSKTLQKSFNQPSFLPPPLPTAYSFSPFF